MASDMRTGRSSNRIALQVGRGNEWSPGLASWMTTGGSECFALPKKRSSLLRRTRSTAGSSHSIINFNLNSTMTRHHNLAGWKSMLPEFALRIYGNLEAHGWPCTCFILRQSISKKHPDNTSEGQTGELRCSNRESLICILVYAKTDLLAVEMQLHFIFETHQSARGCLMDRAGNIPCPSVLCELA